MVAERIHRALMEAIEGESHHGAFDGMRVMTRAMDTLVQNEDAKPDDKSVQQAILALFNDLVRGGQIMHGDPKHVGSRGATMWPGPHVSLTPSGNELLRQANRDPTNAIGYLAYLDQECQIDNTTREYVEESLKTYLACCYKATAVLIGAAVENLILGLRDQLVDGLNKRGEAISNKITGHKIKEVTEGIHHKILPDLRSQAKSDDALRKLKEESESRLLPIAADFRRLRNEAGHPASLGPVLASDVHCNLLQFPSTARLIGLLKKWVSGYYV